MTKEPERVQPATEVSPIETEVDLQASERREVDAVSDERLAIGHMLSGRYRIERVLGEGGMGVVYLATDEQVVGETFAIKVLKEDLGPEALDLLREEVRKTRKLSHPNIVDVHSVNVDGTKLYVLMEYLEGKSLDVLLAEEFGRGMPFSHAWPIIEDVGAALGNAHDHNVIHSDLKPANIFLTHSGKAKLLDFGIARISRGPLLHQRSGPLALTPAYASCEMLEGEEADVRDDTYSFACVIYEMLCGKRPFPQLTALEAREAGAQVPPLGVLTREQNAALAEALAFDRKGRTSSVEQLLQRLADKKARARPTRSVLVGAIVAAVVLVALTLWGFDRLRIATHPVVVQSVPPETQQEAARVAATPFNPPQHSIAVLPFVNMSGDKDQEYFSDGLSEELLNDLSRINELQVAARTSAFSFKGKDTDIGTIARKLNVGAVLEGSVRRSGNTIRITAQLNNAVTGFHIWSQTYDRNLGDVLKLQTEIAAAVAGALKIRLLGDVAERVELGGTHSPAAFDAYLRGSKAFSSIDDVSNLQSAIAAYTEAIRLDPSYALAFAGRSRALSGYATEFATGRAIREFFDRAHADAREALKLSPDLAEGQLALASYFSRGSLDFTHASEAYERAMALAPGNTEVLADSGRFAVLMGHFDAGLAAGRRAVALDPLGPRSRYVLGQALHLAHRDEEAVAAFAEVLSLEPDYKAAYGLRGLAYYGLGDFQSARSSCETKPDSWASQWCLAVTNHKLGQHAAAEAMLKKLQAAYGNAAPVEYATIYAQWGNRSQALEWLNTAMRLRNQDLVYVKTDPLLDPLRHEPRFQAIERELKFPE